MWPYINHSEVEYNKVIEFVQGMYVQRPRSLLPTGEKIMPFRKMPR